MNAIAKHFHLGQFTYHTHLLTYFLDPFDLISLCHAPTDTTLPHYSNRTDMSRTYVEDKGRELGAQWLYESGV